MTQVSSRPAAGADPLGTDEDPQVRAGISRNELIGITAVVLAFLIFGAMMIARSAPLGHDESVYALRARHFAGQPSDTTYWAPYRAPGLPALMSISGRISDGDTAMRLVPLMMAGGLLVLTWLWGRRLFGPTVGVLAAGMVALAPGFATWAWQIGVDVPGAMWAMSAILVFTLASGGERVRPWGLAAIPLAMAAAYTRFGAPVLVGAGMTVVAVAHWRAVRRSLALTAAIAVGTAGSMAAVLLVPAMTGSDVAPARAFEARQVAKDLPFWNSYVDFWSIAPDVLGRWIGIAIGVGVIGLAVAVMRRRVGVRPAAMTLAALLLFIAGLGFGLAQGFVQYLLPAIPFAALLGAAGLVALVRPFPRAVGIGALAMLIVLTAPAAYREAGRSERSLSRGFGVLRAASLQTDRLADDPCVVLTSYSPQVGWYSQCDAVRFANRISDPPIGATRDEIRGWIQIWYDNNIRPLTGDGPVYLMLVKNGKRQPTHQTLTLFEQMTEGVAFELGDPAGRALDHVIVYRFGDPG